MSELIRRTEQLIAKIDLDEVDPKLVEQRLDETLAELNKTHPPSFGGVWKRSGMDIFSCVCDDKQGCQGTKCDYCCAEGPESCGWEDRR